MKSKQPKTEDKRGYVEVNTATQPFFENNVKISRAEYERLKKQQGEQ